MKGGLFIYDTPPAPSLAKRIREESVYYALLIGIDKYRDSLLIFYAGHGYWEEKANSGYWLALIR